jgi:hypothetical protein
MDSSEERNEVPVDDSQLDKHSTVDNESPLDAKIDKHTRLPIHHNEEDISGTKIKHLAQLDECKFELQHNKPKKGHVKCNYSKRYYNCIILISTITI